MSHEGARRVAIGAAVVAVFWIGWRVFRLVVGAPSPEALRDDSWTEGTRVLARDGRLLGERASAEGLRGRSMRLDDVSPRLLDATIASEDRRFRSHDGVDRLALVRAAWTWMKRGHAVSGASTITQQLVKRIDHQGKPRPKTIPQKIREIARAQNLEARANKDELFEAYLNHIDYGHGWAGPEAAAQGYFGVPAKDVSLAQATLLAVLPRAPSALDPYRHLDRAVKRQRALLESMRDHGDISPADFERAIAEPIALRGRKNPSLLLAPHVVLSSDGARRAMAAQKKPGARIAHDVRTTLDFDLQRDVEALVRSHAVRLEQKGATTAAVVVVDNATGDVLAEVGSASYGDAKIAGAVDLVRAKRQPGSTLKPFVYARAFEKGVSPMEMLADVPTEYGGGTESASGSSVVWSPENFDGTFVGPVSAREALAGSLNVPAVRLAAELGAHDVVATLRKSGLSLADGEKKYGLSIALGSGEVTPLELAEAYVTLARGGEHLALRDRTIDRATDAMRLPERVLDASAVAAVAEALADPVARVRGLRTRGPFEFGYPVSVKTGTSTAFRDAWTAGFTRERTVVVWVGNADGSATRKLTGAVGAGPLFFDAMARAMRDVTARQPLFAAELLDEADVCPLSGHRPGPGCTDHVRRWFPHGHAPTHTCTVHQSASARVPAGPAEPAWRCDPEGAQRIVVLPQAYKGWLADRPMGAPGADVRGTPWLLGAQVPGCAPPSGDEPRIVVLSPRDGSVVVSEGGHHDAVDVAVETRGLPAAEPLEVVVDGRLAMRLELPYRGRLSLGRGDHTVEVRPADGRRGALLGRTQVSVR